VNEPATGHFLNPYNFVSLPPRPPAGHPLGDGPPPGHDRYRQDRWSGSIPITVTTVTPLLIPDHTDAARRETGDRPTPPLDVRVDHQGRPILAGSAVKGMLRSAYEAVTNSRLSVFTGDLPLAIRANANDALNLRPGIVVDGPHGLRVTWIDHLHPVPARQGVEPQRAVWVPIRTIKQANARDRDTVEAWIHLLKWTDRGRTAYIWRAGDIAVNGSLPAEPSPVETVLSRKLTAVGHEPVRVRGVLHRTDSKFPADEQKNKKHDERLVVTEVIDKDLAKVVFNKEDEGLLTPELGASWQRVIDSYATAHEHESSLNGKYGTYVSKPEKWRELDVGRTLYVELRGREVAALLPAMIGRRPFTGTPGDNLPEEHHPATSWQSLSPADRVFGWVHVRDGNSSAKQTGARDAYRGHLRIEPGDTQPSANQVDRSIGHLPLTTLNSPKPAQFLFYLGDRNGKPLEGKPKQQGNGYRREPNGPSKRLRGRKVYLTHRDVVGDTDYWTPSTGALPGGRHRQYEAPQGSSADVVTTVSSWVTPGTTFSFTIRVDNIGAMELGALLWLLTLESRHHHKIGLGKPLGFGAVEVMADLAQARLRDGEAMRERYRSLTEPRTATPDELVALRAEFTADAATASVRAEFLAAARGYDGLAVHYPRTQVEPIAESYDWWVANDRKGSGARHALPQLGDKAPRLPYTPVGQEEAGQQSPRTNRSQGRGQRSGRPWRGSSDRR
jgi:CRISPR-associated protein (TIGR03986 family)